MKRLLSALLFIALLVGGCVVASRYLPSDVKTMLDDALGDLGGTLSAIFDTEKPSDSVPGDDTQTGDHGSDDTDDSSQNGNDSDGDELGGAYDENQMMVSADSALQQRLLAAIANRAEEVLLMC